MADKKQKLKTVQELRKLDEKELIGKITELKQSLVEHQRAHAAQELPSTHIIGKTRKQIATALTILGEHRRQPQDAQKEEDK